MRQIHVIRSLQTLGLSLKEVSEYYDNIDNHLQRLMELRASLDRNIQMLQACAAKHGDLTVRSVTLPRQVCFCRQYLCADVAEAAVNLRNAYIVAARTGLMSMTGRMFIARMGRDSAALDLLCCIPVAEEFDGPERREFPETPALSIYYRGPYEGTASAIRALARYVAENHIETTGPFRFIVLEGPPTRGKNAADYITQVAVPIVDRRRGG